VQSISETLQRQRSVARLRTLVVDGDAHDRAESLDDACALARAE